MYICISIYLLYLVLCDSLCRKEKEEEEEEEEEVRR